MKNPICFNRTNSPISIDDLFDFRMSDSTTAMDLYDAVEDSTSPVDLVKRLNGIPNANVTNWAVDRETDTYVRLRGHFNRKTVYLKCEKDVAPVPVQSPCASNTQLPTFFQVPSHNENTHEPDTIVFINLNCITRIYAESDNPDFYWIRVSDGTRWLTDKATAESILSIC